MTLCTAVISKPPSRSSARQLLSVAIRDRPLRICFMAASAEASFGKGGSCFRIAVRSTFGFGAAAFTFALGTAAALAAAALAGTALAAVAAFAFGFPFLLTESFTPH